MAEELILPQKLNKNDSKDDDDGYQLESESVAKKILLTSDEADVFLDEFYGNVYVPGATLRHTLITKLIDFIWNKQCELNTIRAIEKTRGWHYPRRWYYPKDNEKVDEKQSKKNGS